MSGHSKWATTKHKKAVIDARRGKMFAKLIKNIEVAARTGGGDPEGNPTLFDAIQKAKKSSVPNDNIDRAVKRGSGADAGGADYQTITYEGYGPNGVAILVECLTDNRNRAATEVRMAMTRNGGTMADPGSVAYLFTRKGVVIVPKDGLTEDDLLLAVLDAGAEEVNDLGDSFEVVSEATDLVAVRNALRDAGIEYDSADPTFLPSMQVPLDADAARDGLRALGGKLGLDLEATAAGILEVTAWNQANALRQVTVQRGLDVRDFVLVAFGGSGPLLACRLLDVLGLPAVVVPREPGNLSAFGLLTVDVKHDQVQTLVALDAELDLAAVARAVGGLEARAATALDGEGFPREQHRYQRSADLRYFGQAFEVRVPLGDGPVDRALADAAVAAFHDAHQRLYGYCFRNRPEQQVEWVNLRVTGVGPIRRPELAALERGDGDPAPARDGSRPVCFDGGWLEAPVYRRARLRAGDVVHGPAVVEEYGATLPLHPGFRATVDRLGNLVVRAGAAR